MAIEGIGSGGEFAAGSEIPLDTLEAREVPNVAAQRPESNQNSTSNTNPNEVNSIAQNLPDEEKYLGKTGIPEKAFSSEALDTAEPIKTRSGKIVEAVATNDALMIRDTENPYIRIHVAMQNPKEVYAVVDTVYRDGDLVGERHPDFRAGELLQGGVKYLEEMGHEITDFRTHWDAGSRGTNYEQFKENLKASDIDVSELSEITPEDPGWNDVETAATNTWTGNTIDSMGFKRIKGIDITDSGAVEMIFTREPGMTTKTVESISEVGNRDTELEPKALESDDSALESDNTEDYEPPEAEPVKPLESDDTLLENL